MAIRITREQLRRIIHEAAFDDEGTPTGAGMANVTKTSETRLANAIDDALMEDSRFNEMCVRLAAAARQAVMRSSYVPIDAEELVDDDFEQDFVSHVVSAAGEAILGAIKTNRAARSR